MDFKINQMQKGAARPLASTLAILLLTLLVATGCREDAVSAPAGQAPNTVQVRPPNNSPRQAQPKLPAVKLFVGTNEITAEIASTPIQIQTGMMWRTNLGEMEGMLFVFPRPQPVSFYMRNTLVPLTCAYIDPEGVILELHDMKPLDETSIPSASDQVQYVLEMNQGWFARHGVKPGMQFATPHGTFRQTFLRSRGPIP